MSPAMAYVAELGQSVVMFGRLFEPTNDMEGGMSNSQKVQQLINSKWKSKVCPMCHVNNWDGSEDVFQLMQFSKGGLSVGGPVVPVLPITCSSCGYTVLINAMVAGIVKP